MFLDVPSLLLVAATVSISQSDKATATKAPNDGTTESVTEAPDTAESSHERFFKACSSRKSVTDTIETYSASSAIQCAARCLREKDCSAFNLCHSALCEPRRFCCELSFYEGTNCGDMSADPSCTHYMRTEPGKENLEPEEAEVQTEPWRRVLTHDTMIIQGGLDVLQTHINSGADIVVVLNSTAHTRVIALDSALISPDYDLITGGAYIFDADPTGVLYQAYVQVATNGHMCELHFSQNGINEFELTPIVHWFTRQIMISCQTNTPPNMGGNTKVVSTRGSQGTLTYTGYSKTTSDNKNSLLGLFIKDFDNSSMDYHLREADLYHQAENYVTVDFARGQGDGDLKPDMYLISRAIIPDGCWELVFGKDRETDSDALKATISTIRSGVRMFMHIDYYDSLHSLYVAQTFELERVKLIERVNQVPIIRFHSKVNAVYGGQRLQWKFFTVDTSGEFLRDGNLEKEWFDYQIYAETRKRPNVFSIDSDLTTTTGSVGDAVMRLKDGRLPRLMVQSDQENSEYFDIQYAKVLLDNTMILRSYRSMTNPGGSFDVFTFNVTWCQYTVEDVAMGQNNQWEMTPSQKKPSAMTLFFEE